MWSLITELKDTPVPTILVIAGIGFLLLALAGDIEGRIKVKGLRQWFAGVTGLVFIGLGIVMYLSPQMAQPLVVGVQPPPATPGAPTAAPSVTIAPTATTAPTPTNLPSPTASATAAATIEATTPPLPPTVVVTPTTPDPPPTATAVATSMPVAPPIAFGDPRAWMLTPEDFPAALVQQSEREVTNDIVAQDPLGNLQPQVLQDLQRWGRITGYQRTYGYPDEAQPSRVYRVFVQSVVYESAAGAEQGFAWGRTTSDSAADASARSQSIGGIGEHAYLLARNDRFGRDVRLVEVAFKRHNVLGMISLATIPGSLRDQDVGALAIQLARLMDLNIQVAAAPQSFPTRPQQEQPEQSVRIYFEAINDHNYDASWSRLTPAFRDRQSVGSQAAYIDYWSGAGRVEVAAVELDRRNGNRALVAVRLKYLARSKEADYRYVLLFDETQGRWLFDDGRELSVPFFR